MTLSLSVRQCQSLILLGLFCCWPAVPALALDVFDRHTVAVLKQAIEGADGSKSLTQSEALKLKPLAKDLESSCIVVETSAGNFSKVLLSWGFRKSANGADQKVVPVLMLDRFVTYERNNGDSTVAKSRNIMLFPGFRFDFDLGQVVPEGFDADVEFTEQGVLRCVGPVKLFGLSGSQLPVDEAEPAKATSDKTVISPEDFTGIWQVNGDGRWVGEWDLTVNEAGQASGKFFSAESQASYPISGHVGVLPHQIKLQVQFNNATQVVDAYLWTKDKSAIAGSFTLAGRKFGFYATREVSKVVK